MSVAHLLSKSSQLPTIPGVAARVLVLLNDPDVSASDLQEAIAADQVLTGHILKVANSAVYSLPRLISSVTEAIVLLGLKRVGKLVLVGSIQDLYSVKGALKLEKRLWEHTVGAALAARVLSRRVGFEQEDDLFVATLLHDIGKLVFLQNEPEIYVEMIRDRDNPAPLCRRERSAFGCDHAELGAALLERWGMDGRMIAAVSLHHEEERGSRLRDLLRLGNRLAHRAGWTLGEPPTESLSDFPSAKRLALGETDLLESLEDASKLLAKERSLFGI